MKDKIVEDLKQIWAYHRAGVVTVALLALILGAGLSSI